MKQRGRSRGDQRIRSPIRFTDVDLSIVLHLSPSSNEKNRLYGAGVLKRSAPDEF